MNNELYRVIYKGVNGGFKLSDDMDFDAACQFTVKHNLPGSQKSADCPYQA